MRITDVTPLHVDKLLQSRLQAESSPKTVRNLVGLLQSMFSPAVDNDLILGRPFVARTSRAWSDTKSQ